MSDAEPVAPRADHATRWQKGQSGNPAGRPKGARNRTSAIAEKMLEAETEKLMRRAIDGALGDDKVALKLCLQRVLAPARHRPIELDLPDGDAPADHARRLAETRRALAQGAIAPEEAARVAELIEAEVRIMEAVEMEARLRRVEQSLGLAPDPA
jgi:hypothetical protein